MPLSATHVAIGATFACDAALARPLEVLLQEAVKDRGDVSVDWLDYGSAADPTGLNERLQRAPADLIVLLIRLSDLRAAHPELGTTNVPESSEHDLLMQLDAYERHPEPHIPPLVLVFCPSPPVDGKSTFLDEEATLCDQINTFKRVSWRPSTDLVEFFDSDRAAFDWYSEVGDKRKHAPFTQRMLNVLALSCTRQIHRLFIRSSKKVIVLDCDNTLWGGAAADLGPEGVDLSERFLALQRFVLEEQRRGVLLCLCSKNIAGDVDAVFTKRASDLVLQKDQHIVVSKVNWRDKSRNICEIAQELSLDLDAFVLIDDNVVECHEVQSALPMVTVVHLPQDFGAHYLKTQWVFDSPLDFRSTGEDGDRTKMYRDNARRNQLRRHATSQAAFLSSLGIRIQCERIVDPSSLAFDRILQLHQRTNTFNVATTFSRALSSDVLLAYATQPLTHFALTSTVTDRYGHYGLVCVALFRRVDTTFMVDSFLMSCRSLNRGVEHAMLKRIAEIAVEWGVEAIEVAWEPTARNEPARLFFASASSSVFVRKSKSEPDVVTCQAEKISKSADERGVWRFESRAALEILFLQELESDSTSVDPSLLQQTRMGVHDRIVRVLGTLVRFAKRWFPLLWLVRLVSWFVRHCTNLGSNSTKTISSLATSIHFHEHGHLDRFLAIRMNMPSGSLSGTHSHQHAGESEDDQVANESDEAFRLRVRHQTKLALLEHVSPDTPRVVWAPHRSDDIRLDTNDHEDLLPPSAQLQQFHRPCATPACFALVYWESACAFERCRTCCYRLQRLLNRATGTQIHPKARRQAELALVSDFKFRMDEVSSNDQRCSAHTNDKKRR